MKPIEWKHNILTFDRIGRGLYSNVYKSFDPDLQKNVAVKVLKNVEIAELEVSVMQKYGNSRYFPALYDFMIMRGKAYIFMEYIEGQPLGKHFTHPGERKEESLSVQITINLLRAVLDLHNCGYMHRDIKPKNVMIHNDRSDSLRLIDFNHARRITETDSVQRDLQDAARMCVFLLEGSVPESIEDINLANPHLQSVLLKAFRVDEEDRYRSADEFIKALLVCEHSV